MSKSWPLLAFVSLKYCAENKLLKTHVAFFMTVTVDDLEKLCCGSLTWLKWQEF
jgi:hypothetical protein